MLEGKHGNKRLIDANLLVSTCEEIAKHEWNKKVSPVSWADAYEGFIDTIEEMPTVDALEVPCKIGDFVYAIRSFNGHTHPQSGIVSDMFFTKDMKLMIVVKYVARGEWGKTVFATDKEAYAAIGERRWGE